jgi:hypothetical protein
MYPMSDELKRAIDTLFTIPSPAYRALGATQPLSKEWYTAGALPDSFAERSKLLRKKLESYLFQMSAESTEYGNPDEITRLQAEARGLLVALREIALHLPECRAESS